MMRTMTMAVVLAAAVAAAQGKPGEAKSPAEERLSVATQAYSLAFSQYRTGTGGGNVETVALWSKRLYEASKDGSPKALEEHIARLQNLEQLARTRVSQGTSANIDLLTVSYLRAEAQLLQGKK